MITASPANQNRSMPRARGLQVTTSGAMPLALTMPTVMAVVVSGTTVERPPWALSALMTLACSTPVEMWPSGRRIALTWIMSVRRGMETHGRTVSAICLWFEVAPGGTGQSA